MGKLSPSFGDVVENGYASEDNPTRRGFFVRAFKRTGRMNPGLTWEITDKLGKFWEIQPAIIGERLTVVPAARSEAQPSGYDGGKSLGERLYGTLSGDLGWVEWSNLSAVAQGRWERSALTFTASLSDASEVDELKARLAHVEALGRAGSYKATPEHSWQEWADEWRREALASEDKLKEIKALARQFSPVMSTDEAHSFGDALHKLLSPSSGDE